MDTATPRRVIDVRSTDRGLVVSAATHSAAELVGAPHSALLGAEWGPQFAPADRQSVVRGSADVLDGRRAAWSGELRLAHREGCRVRASITRPAGGWSPRIKIQLTDLHDTARASDPRSAVECSQDEFITSVSHELRTPLTSILGYTSVLLDGSVGDLTSLQTRMVQRVESNGQRLVALVENLLVLSDIQAGSFCLVRTHVDLADVVADSLTRAGRRLEARELDLRVDLARPCHVLGDETQLGRAVSCLIDNAVTFSRPGGEIRVLLERHGDELVLEISDTGVGIAPEQQERLFERFVRAPDASQREDPGLGLGLAVARSIISSHHGTVGLRSTPGVGTVATIRLPAATAGRIHR